MPSSSIPAVERVRFGEHSYYTGFDAGDLPHLVITEPASPTGERVTPGRGWPNRPDRHPWSGGLAYAPLPPIHANVSGVVRRRAVAQRTHRFTLCGGRSIRPNPLPAEMNRLITAVALGAQFGAAAQEAVCWPGRSGASRAVRCPGRRGRRLLDQRVARSSRRAAR